MKQRMQPKNPEPKREKSNKYQGGSKQNNQPRPRLSISQQMNTNRGEAIRAGRRNMDSADKAVDRWKVFEKHNQHQANFIPLNEPDKLRITPIGGQDSGGSKNMIVVEYGDEAVVLDCGFDLSVDLPGINYAINDLTYLETIKHKIKGYIISHGHLDHIGGLPYTVPNYPAPIYGSHFTNAMVQKQFEGAVESGIEFEPETINMVMDNHERLVIGKSFTVELVRVTHAIPDSSVIVLDTPVGRIINTGDFRLDPEPLDQMPTDIARLTELGKEGVMLLMSESTATYREGRTPTEHTLQPSFHDLIQKAPGRIFVAIFSSNMNRVQMIINSAVAAGRKVAFDGRSMMAVAEMAIRLGNLKIPKGSVIPMREAPNVKDDQLVVICTGGQGEPNAALQRMSIGEHKHIKLKEGDTVVVSSTPIPGNEIRYEEIGNDLTDKGVKLFRHPTHNIDGSGPLHVSGHASRDEYQEMIEIVNPKYFMPIYGGPLTRKYNAELGYAVGVPKDNTIMANNGTVVEFDQDGRFKIAGEIPTGALLIDQTGAIVPGLVAKDRLLMSEEGMVVVILTVDKKTGRLLTSPDIITRGFIYIRDNAELMDGLRAELKRAAAQRFARVDIDRFKQELKDHITHYLYEHTKRNPILIPVVNIIGPNGKSNVKPKPAGDSAH